MTRAQYLIWLLTAGLYLIGLIGVCGFAWIKGRAAERLGALIYVLSVFGSTLVYAVCPQSLAASLELACDALVAVGFLLLALRYNSLWLGAGMIVKGAQLALHASHLTDEADVRFAGVKVYEAGLSLISFALLGILLGGTFASIRERRRVDAGPTSGDEPLRSRPATTPLSVETV